MTGPCGAGAGELASSSLSSRWSDEHVAIERVESLAGGVEAESALAFVANDDAGNLTREEEKAYSQNFGHESIWTTRESYGTLPGHRQAEVMRRLAVPKAAGVPEAAIAAMQAALDRLKAARVD